jgi:fluoride exporter
VLKLILIACGGAAGSVLRYALSGWVQGWVEHGPAPLFPWGILAVNVTGCLAIGVLGALFTGPLLIREEYRVALLVGVLGGYTTLSAFGYDTVSMAQRGQFALAGLNVLLSNALGLLAVWAGVVLVRARYGG